MRCSWFYRTQVKPRKAPHSRPSLCPYGGKYVFLEMFGLSKNKHSYNKAPHLSNSLNCSGSISSTDKLNQFLVISVWLSLEVFDPDSGPH